MDRQSILANLRVNLGRSEIIVGAGAGNGLSAKFVERGGVDFILVYNSGKYRMAGRGSLAGMMPYGDANAIVTELGREILPVVQRIPVIAGVCGTDPFRLMPQFVDFLSGMGFAGVQNFPSVGLIDGVFRQNLEETGMGYGKEVELIATAHDRGLLTVPYVFTPENAEAMARAGADVLVAHVGLTTSGSIGARTAMSLDAAADAVQAMRDAAAAVAPDAIVLCHGGPIATVPDVLHILNRTEGVSGFVGASTIERLASEQAVQAAAEALKGIRLEKPHLSSSGTTP